MFSRRTVQNIPYKLFHHKSNPLENIQKKLSEHLKLIPNNLNTELKKTILLNSINEALDNKNALNRLALKDAQIPQNLSLEKKLEIAQNLRKKYYARPVLTSHPTEVLSEEARVKINRIIKNIFSENTNNQQLNNDIEWIFANSLLPSQNLSPEDEIDRQDELYLDMMESWSSYNRKNIEAFAKNHHQKKEAIQEFLTKINKYSYSNVSSWAVADVDGNKMRTRKTMEHMETSLQLAIVNRYMQHLFPLIANHTSLQSSYEYLSRCKKAIEDNIFFNLEGSELAKHKLLSKLDKVVVKPMLSEVEKKQLMALRDLIELVGFRGDLKQFVRQSSKSNKEAFNDIARILTICHKDVHDLFQNRPYSELNNQEKAKFHNLLRNNSAYIRTLKEQKEHLSQDTMRELDILNFVLDYNDQFSYILSDTENYLSLTEVIILFGISAYFNGRLYVDDIRKPPVNLIPLCETPEDLKNLPKILDEMLSNQYLKKVIINKGEIVYVAGPSDLGKEGGLFAHINLIEAEKQAQDILDYHQKLDDNLKDVQLRVLYGLGGDFHRRISQASYQLFATFQGSDACKLGSFTAFENYVEKVTGQASENSFRALELRLIESARPEDYQVLKEIIEKCISNYQKFTQHNAARDLFRKLSIPYALGILTNTSSRGESKSTVAKDILSSRAIGLANYDIATLYMTRIFMSADGLVDCSITNKSSFESLYECSTTVQEVVQKILFAASIARENRAWLKIVGHIPNKHKICAWAQIFTSSDDAQAQHALAYASLRLPKILKNLSMFILKEEQFNDFWDNELPEPIDELAMHLIEYAGKFDEQYLHLAQEITYDLKPRYHRLAQCIDEYNSASNESDKQIHAENFVMALRGDKKVCAGPQTIANLHNRFDAMINPSLSLDRKSSTYLSKS